MTTSSTPRSEPLSSQAARQPPPSLTALAQLLCLLMGHAMLLYSTSRYFWHVCRRMLCTNCVTRTVPWHKHVMLQVQVLL